MITLEVEPSLCIVRQHRRFGPSSLTGRDWAHVMLEGSDPERIVRVSLAASELMCVQADSANRRPPGSAAA